MVGLAAVLPGLHLGQDRHFSVMLGLDPSTPTDCAAKSRHVLSAAIANGGARVKPEHDESTSTPAPNR